MVVHCSAWLACLAVLWAACVRLCSSGDFSRFDHSPKLLGHGVFACLGIGCT